MAEGARELLELERNLATYRERAESAERLASERGEALREIADYRPPDNQYNSSRMYRACRDIARDALRSEGEGGVGGDDPNRQTSESEPMPNGPSLTPEPERCTCGSEPDPYCPVHYPPAPTGEAG